MRNQLGTPWRRSAAVLRQAIRADLRDHTAQNSLVVLAGQIARLVLGLVSSALLARSLGPEGLRVFSVVAAALAIASTTVDFGLSQSAVRQIAGRLAGDSAHEPAAQAAAGGYALWKILFTLAAGAALLVVAGPTAALLKLPSASGRALVVAAVAGLTAASLSGITVTVLQALRRFPALVASQVANAALTVLLMGGLYAAGRLTTLPALWVGAITALVATGLGYALLPPGWRRPLLLAGRLRSSESQRLLAFSRWLWISAILAIVLAQLDLLLLNWRLKPDTVGHYALALNLAFKADILNQTMLTVLLPAVSALAETGRYRAYLGRNLVRSALLSIPLSAGFLLARPFISLVYGAEFAPSVGLFQALLIVTIFDLFATPILLLAYPLNMPHLLAGANALRVLTLLVGGLVLIPIWGPFGVIWAKLVAKLIGAAFLGLLITRRLRASQATAARPGT